MGSFLATPRKLDLRATAILAASEVGVIGAAISIRARESTTGAVSLAGAVAADVAIATIGVVRRVDTGSAFRIARLAGAARYVGALVDTGAVTKVKMFAGWTLVAHALLLATLQVRTTTGSIARTKTHRHTLAGSRILGLAGRAGDRRTFAGTGVQIKRLALRARLTRTDLIATDLLRTTTQPIRLSIADITETGVRVRWSTTAL